MSDKNKLTSEFRFYWRALADDLPEPIEEYRFHKPRRWKFDRAWVDARVAVELEGGVFSNGRHTKGVGYSNDCEKYNQAQIDGWIVLRYTVKHMENPHALVGQIREALLKRGVREVCHI